MLHQEILETLRGLHRPLSPTDDLVLSLSVEEWMRLRGQVLCLARAKAVDLEPPGDVKAAALALQGLNLNEIFALVEQSSFLPEVANAPKTSALAEFLVRELRTAPGPMVEKLWKAVWAGHHKLSLFQTLDWPLADRQIQRILDELAGALEEMPKEDQGDITLALAKLLGHLGYLRGQADIVAPGVVRAVAAGALNRFPLFERTLRQLSTSEGQALAVLRQLGGRSLKRYDSFAKKRLPMTALALLIKQLDPVGTAFLQEAQQSQMSDALRDGLLWVSGFYSGADGLDIHGWVDGIVNSLTSSEKSKPSLLEALAGLVDGTVRFSDAAGESLENRIRDLSILSEGVGVPRSDLKRELLLAAPYLFGRVSERAWERQKSRVMEAARADELSASIALLSWPQKLNPELVNGLWQNVEKNSTAKDLLARLWETKFGIQSIQDEFNRSRGKLSAGLKACFSACAPVEATMDKACQLIAEMLEHSLHLTASATQSLLDTSLRRIPPGRLEMTSSLRELTEEFLAEEPGPYSESSPHRVLSIFYYRQWDPCRP